MSDTSNQADQNTEQWAAFQKIWMDTMTRMMQLGAASSPEGAPPEFLRNIRSGIFQALNQSWDEFLRSPQFLEGMKQWMESALTFRKLTNDFLTKARHETQTTAREDVDTMMLTVRHMETRILDRVEELAGQVDTLNRKLEAFARDTPAQPLTASPPRKAPPKRKKRHA